ncbi:MAG: recombinase XerD, partial [Nevskia sp.]|nr:recombinase XerD [Nevskia sp.]
RTEAKAIEGKRRLESHRVKRWGEQPARTYDDIMFVYLRDTESKKSHSRDLDSAAHLSKRFSGKTLPIAADEIAAYKRERATEPSFRVNRRRKVMPTISPATIAKELWLLSAAIRHVNKEYDWKLENPGQWPGASAEEERPPMANSRRGKGAARCCEAVEALFGLHRLRAFDWNALRRNLIARMATRGLRRPDYLV